MARTKKEVYYYDYITEKTYSREKYEEIQNIRCTEQWNTNATDWVIECKEDNKTLAYYIKDCIKNAYDDWGIREADEVEGIEVIR